jgi:hypothetical protein
MVAGQMAACEMGGRRRKEVDDAVNAKAWRTRGTVVAVLMGDGAVIAGGIVVRRGMSRRWSGTGCC